LSSIVNGLVERATNHIESLGEDVDRDVVEGDRDEYLE
jgi:hypothetical protein